MFRLNKQKKQEKQEYVTGTVIKVGGTLARLVKSNGAYFGNESVKIGNPTYVLQIQTPQGLYTASIKEWNKPLEALALAIENGCQVRIKKDLLDNKYTLRFEEDKVGHLNSDEVIVESQK